MARPLNTVPRALLDLLGLKTGGTNPLGLGDELEPTLEIADLYKMSRVEHTGVTSALLQDRGDSAELLVPENEVWFLWALSANAGSSLQAGDTLQISAGIASEGGSVIMATSPKQVLSVDSENPRANTGPITPPLVLVPKDSIFLQVESVIRAVAPSFSGSIRARVSRFGPNTEILSA